MVEEEKRRFDPRLFLDQSSFVFLCRLGVQNPPFKSVKDQIRVFQLLRFKPHGDIHGHPRSGKCHFRSFTNVTPTKCVAEIIV